MAKIDLASYFEPLSAAQWKQRIQYELGGDDYTETLVWESPDGIKVKPFYTAGDLEKHGARTQYRGTPWKIAEDITVSDAASANARAKNALEKGVESLYFTLTSGVDPGKLLSGIDLKQVPVHFRMGFMPVRLVPSLLQALPKSPAGVFLHLDIIGHLALTGNWFGKREEDFAGFQELLKATSHENTHFTGVDGSTYHNAGATVVQQLAYSLAHAHEYVSTFKDDLHRPPVFTLAIGPEFFFEIAKFRALRMLWAALAPEYGLPTACHIVAVPGTRNKTIYDYNNNILRTASECMSAILGNADTVVNLPYDVLYRERNEFSSRLARNQLLILRHESHFDDVSAAADGSYYIETLTRQLAEKSLDLFKQIEAGGGFLQQLTGHKIQKKVKESAEREQKRFNAGESILVGANHQRQQDEEMKDSLEFAPFVGSRPVKTAIEPLRGVRLASALEKKRLHHE